MQVQSENNPPYSQYPGPEKESFEQLYSFQILKFLFTLIFLYSVFLQPTYLALNKYGCILPVA